MKKWFFNQVLRHVYQLAIPEDVVSITKDGKVHLGDDVVTEAELKNLVAEASFIKRTRLWSLMTETLRLDAQQRMFNNSTSYQDMLNGKMMMYNISVQEKILKLFEKPDIKSK